MTEMLAKPLSVEAWKLLLKNYVYIYPNGVYRLSGSFARSRTFGLLKATRNEINMIRGRDGRIKEPWLSTLADFMRDRRSKEGELAILEDHILVVLGILRLITEASMKT